MANIMSMVQLRNNVSRNGFDLSQKRNFSAKSGELTPCMCVPCMAGDVHQWQPNGFTRTESINTAAYARMREYYDYYFVPFNQLWNKFDTVITQMKDNLQVADGPFMADNETLSLDLPFFTCESIARYITALLGSGKDYNLFGFTRSYGTVRLLSYLGYPDFSIYLDSKNTWDTMPMPVNKMLSPFPLLAYQKVYSDFFRNSQWEKANPSNFNLNYIKGSNDLEIDLSDLKYFDELNFLDLRYANYNKDLFFGVLPNAQYGDTAAVPLNFVPGAVTSGLFNFSSAPANNSGVSIDNPNNFSSARFKTDSGAKLTSIPLSSSAPVSELNILMLRQYEALQRWKEITQSVGQDYKSQIEAHLNVKVSELLSGQSHYIGGIASSLDINPVINTNLVDENATTIKGTGTIASNGNLEYEVRQQYGLIIGLYHVTPIFDYCVGQTALACQLTSAFDFPIPELDRIGMESVPLTDLINPTADDNYVLSEMVNKSPNAMLGYAPRYVRWKTEIDISLGQFSKKSGQSWVLPMNYELLESQFYPGQKDATYSYNLSWAFFKCNPHALDPIFAFKADSTYDTDQFRVSYYCQHYVVRSLDKDGLPY